MAKFIVNYDLRNNRDYQALERALKSYQSYARVLRSCWIVISDKPAYEVTRHLLSHMDEDDGLFVAKLERESSWHKVDCTDEWLHSCFAGDY